MIAASSPVLVVGLIFAVFFGATSFLVANTFRQSTGRSPWGIHPGIWLAIGFVFGFIGFILCLVARFTTRERRPGPDAPYPGVGYGPGPYGQAPYGQPGPYGQPSGYPQPTGAWGAQPAPAPTYDPQPAAVSVPAPTPAGNPPAEWYADPSGKHTHRYWNGTNWTEHVADNGVASIDPVPPEAQPSGAPPVNPA